MDKEIIYTKTDEAPALATYSWLPIVRNYLKKADVSITSKDISLAGRILSLFPDYLKYDQKVDDDLSALGNMTANEKANIIKLPNISASVPQLTAAIDELQNKGFNIPDYPFEPKTDKDQDILKRYKKVLGSAVNPVLRQGNSDRRVAEPVKNFARNNPHSMGEWSSDSKSHVAHMTHGDFYASEQSKAMPESDVLSIVLETENGESILLKDHLEVQDKEVLDASFMSKKALRDYIKQEIKDAKDKDVLFSVHLKATMMKVSDPVIFGHVVEVYYEEILDKYKADLDKINFNSNNGIGDLYDKLDQLDDKTASDIKKDIDGLYEHQPDLAMVDSHNGITNLHVPSNVIIDASMPAAVRSSGKMWNKNDQLQDMKALIPDRSYASIYQEVIDFCKENGAFDPKSMGNVSNVGLMAQKAEEYGSHDKTFIIADNGTVKVKNQKGETHFSHKVEQGDIWRMCQTKDLPIKDWVRLAVKRGKETGSPVIFWLDENRAHDQVLKQKVNNYLKLLDLNGVEVHILNPKEAMHKSCELVKQGKDCISVTGNVLRDYLTDLFPILELGTSAKMLSIVPLLAGGGLFETGAGGSAPKHVQQFLKEGHLRWDSLGEFLALAVSLEEFADTYNNDRAKVMAKALNEANDNYLKNNNSPSRNVNEIDNRGSQFYLAYYWAKALSAQNDDQALKEDFKNVYQQLSDEKDNIEKELLDAQGKPVDIKGYYYPKDQLIFDQMRPSKTFNAIVESIK
ncbi:MAG: NADP-dependent isocitrate dehydrogenase [Psychroflexus sp.]|nr:NADP-dependent isocitrate dehydrogenase [Psychroflexus sp.]